jgi:hypothetical protein
MKNVTLMIALVIAGLASTSHAAEVLTLKAGSSAAFLSIDSNSPVVVRCQPSVESVKVACSCAFAGIRYEFHVTTIDRNGAINDKYVSPFFISSSKEQSHQECLEAISSNPVCGGNRPVQTIDLE